MEETGQQQKQSFDMLRESVTLHAHLESNLKGVGSSVIDSSPSVPSSLKVAFIGAATMTADSNGWSVCVFVFVHMCVFG